MLKKIFAFFWIAFTLFLFLLFFECGVRLYDSFSLDKKKANLSESVYAQVPFLDLRLLPGIRFKDNPDIFKFFLTPFNTNGHGFRGKEFQNDKEKGIFRVVCVGASTTFGHGSSSDETTFPAILETKLNQRNGSGIKYEVINAGIPGYSALQLLIIFNAQILELNPDVIIIYSGWNDISNMFRLDASTYEKMFVGVDRISPELLRKEDKYHTKSRWAIIRQIGRWKYKADKKKKVINQEYKQVTGKEERKQLMVNNIRKYMEDDYFFNRPLRIYKNSVDSIILLAKKRGIEVCILTLPAMIKSDSSEEMCALFNKRFPDSATFIKGDFYTQMRLEVQDKFNSMIRDLASDDGCILVDIDKAMPDNSGVFELFCDEVHFSDQGNDFAAGLILEEMSNKGILR